MMAPYGILLRRTNRRSVLAAAMGVAISGRAWAKRPIRVLVLGDSLTAGYGLSLPEGFQAQMTQALRLAGWDVSLVDGAVSGDTTAGGRARLDWAIGDGVDAALVELGANDGLRGLDTAAMEANLSAILDALAARHVPVLLSGMEAPPNMGQAYVTAFRAVFARLGKRPGVIFDPFFLEGVAGDASLIQGDHLHPNAAGVRKEVARLVPFMDRLLREVPA